MNHADITPSILLYKNDQKLKRKKRNGKKDKGIIPAANLAVFQKGVWYSGIKIYNHLPPTLKQLSYDISKFTAALKRFLLTSSFYTLEDYYT